MKKSKLLLGAFALCGFMACNNNDEHSANTSDSFTSYIDSVENASAVYTSAAWEDIARGYETREQELNARMEKLSAEEKADAEKAKAKYAELKSRYETKLKETKADADANNMKPDGRMTLGNALFGDGKLGADMGLGWVNASNVVEVYNRFVSTVDKENDKYTKQDWENIETFYSALDARKEAVEKELSGKDKFKITERKARYGVLKAVNKPRAEGTTRDKVEDDIKDATRNAGNATEEAAHDAKSATKEAAHDAKNATKEAAHDTKRATKEAAHDTKEAVKKAVD